MHAGKLGQATNFRRHHTAKHCVDKYMVLFLLLFARGDAMPCRLHARLCHAFLVLKELALLITKELYLI